MKTLSLPRLTTKKLLTLTTFHILLATAQSSGIKGKSVGHLQKSRADQCHVYVVDVLQASKMQKEVEKAEPSEYKKIAARYKTTETVFPVFEAEVAEETQTTKHFPFPNSKLFITASVYYTDEMMASGKGDFSMMLGVFVSPRKSESSLGAENVGNAVAELAYSQSASKARVKQYVIVNGRKYLLGLECESSAQTTKD